MLGDHDRALDHGDAIGKRDAVCDQIFLGRLEDRPEFEPDPLALPDRDRGVLLARGGVHELSMHDLEGVFPDRGERVGGDEIGNRALHQASETRDGWCFDEFERLQRPGVEVEVAEPGEEIVGDPVDVDLRLDRCDGFVGDELLHRRLVSEGREDVDEVAGVGELVVSPDRHDGDRCEDRPDHDQHCGKGARARRRDRALRDVRHSVAGSERKRATGTARMSRAGSASGVLGSPLPMRHRGRFRRVSGNT